MGKGFFVTLTQRKSTGSATVMKGVKYWQADLVEPIKDWPKTNGETIEANLDQQKAQYLARAQDNQRLPDLVDMDRGPMASGKTVRFVPV